MLKLYPTHVIVVQHIISNHYDTGSGTQAKENKGTETEGGRRSDQ